MLLENCLSIERKAKFDLIIPHETKLPDRLMTTMFNKMFQIISRKIRYHLYDIELNRNCVLKNKITKIKIKIEAFGYILNIFLLNYKR